MKAIAKFVFLTSAIGLLVFAGTPGHADTCRKVQTTRAVETGTGPEQIHLIAADYFVSSRGYTCVLMAEQGTCSHDDAVACFDSAQCEALSSGSTCQFEQIAQFVSALCDDGEVVQGGSCAGYFGIVHAEAMCCKDACVTDADCEGGVCGGAGGCVECASDGDCEGDEFCELESCHPRRVTQAGCDRAEQCQSGTCTSGACG